MSTLGSPITVVRPALRQTITRTPPTTINLVFSFALSPDGWRLNFSSPYYSGLGFFMGYF